MSAARERPPGARSGRVTGVVHVHSDYSHDGRDSLERLRDAALERGIGFVALTDHAEDFAPELFEEYVAHCRALSDERVSLIPGLEFRFRGFTGLHLLALGLREWIEPDTPDRFAELAPSRAGLTIVAHPVLARYEVPESVRATIDAVEVWNAAYNTRYLPDPRAIALLHEIRARRPEVVGTAGLDQHDSRNDRETRVIVAAGADPLAEIRAGRFTSAGRTMSLDPRVSLPPLRLRTLAAARWALDRVERVQRRVAFAFARA